MVSWELRERNTTVTTENEGRVPDVRAEWQQRELPDEDRAYLLRTLFGPDPAQPLILMQITPRQQEILAEVVHDLYLAEGEDGDDRDYLAELADLDELIRGAHPKWNGQQQAFFPADEEGEK